MCHQDCLLGWVFYYMREIISVTCHLVYPMPFIPEGEPVCCYFVLHVERLNRKPQE